MMLELDKMAQLGKLLLTMLALASLTSCAALIPRKPPRPPLFPPYAYEYKGKFRPTFYLIADENAKPYRKLPKEVPLLTPSGDTIAWVSRAFKRELDIEGTGRLSDGRLINFAGRAPDGIRYQVLTDAPFGLGVDNYRLIPYRTIAVDPTRILIGSVVFIPQAYGVRLPSGEIHDGFFLAHDIGGAIKGDRIDIFLGDIKDWKKNAFSKAGRIKNLQPVDLYVVREPLESAVNRRFQKQFTWKRREPLYRMRASEIDRLIKDVSQSTPDVRQRIQIYSERAKGTPYLIFCLGEGPHAPYDPDPLVDFSRVDCMTFSEQMLALAISNSYSEMFDNLQRIRYKDGIIDFKKRNHFTLADWLPNNSWLLYDATQEIGDTLCLPMTKTIDRRADFLRMGCTDTSDVPPPQTMTISYIPTENLPKIKDRLQGGEIVTIVSDRPGIFSAHMGLIVRDKYGNVLFRHASSQERFQKVVDEFFDDVIAYLRAKPSLVGMVFMRIRRDFEKFVNK